MRTLFFELIDYRNLNQSNIHYFYYFGVILLSSLLPILKINKMSEIDSNAKLPSINKRNFDIGLNVSFITVSIGLIVWYHLVPKSEIPFTLIIGFSGLITGLFVGFLNTPFSPKETKNFGGIRTALFGFVTGYAFSKLVDPILDSFTSGMLNEQNILRILIFSIGLFWGFKFMVIYRNYYLSDKYKEEQESKDKS